MYSSDLEQLFTNAGFVINFVIQTALLIVFLRVAWNVGQIRKSVARNNSDYLLKEAEKMEFKSKTKEAIDLYLDYIFIVMKSGFTTEAKKGEIAPVAKKIIKLGGSIPEQATRYV